MSNPGSIIFRIVVIIVPKLHTIVGIIIPELHTDVGQVVTRHLRCNSLDFINFQ
jgi:hypothetical protein